MVHASKVWKSNVCSFYFYQRSNGKYSYVDDNGLFGNMLVDIIGTFYCEELGFEFDSWYELHIKNSNLVYQCGCIDCNTTKNPKICTCGGKKAKTSHSTWCDSL